VFFLGAPVAVLIACLTWFAPESRAWHVQRASSLRVIFSSLFQHSKIFFYLLIVMAIMLCLSHGTQDLYPDFLKSMDGMANRRVLGMKMLYGIPILYNIAAVAGALLFGYLSQKIGRRFAIMLALVAALVSIPAWAFGSTVLMLTLGSCLMQAGGQGAFGVIPAHINELAPASVRGLFPGFVYQLGVLIASPGTAIELKLKESMGYPWALTVFETIVIVILLFMFYFGPEEHSKDFSQPTAELQPIAD